MPGSIPSAETKAWICTADDCFNVEPQLHKTFCCKQLLNSCFLKNTFSNWSYCIHFSTTCVMISQKLK